MLVINEGFKLITYPENEEKLLGILDKFDVAIENGGYTNVYPWATSVPQRLVLECHASVERYDELLEYLDKNFDSWISLIE